MSRNSYKALDVIKFRDIPRCTANNFGGEQNINFLYWFFWRNNFFLHPSTVVYHICTSTVRNIQMRDKSITFVFLCFHILSDVPISRGIEKNVNM